MAESDLSAAYLGFVGRLSWLGRSSVVMGVRVKVVNPPCVVVFDLDDTLAPSKSPVDEAMASRLRDLLQNTRVCVISGGSLQQFESQLLARLPGDSRLGNLHLMPTCGTRYYLFDSDRGKWVAQYTHDLSVDQKSRAVRALSDAARHLGLWPDHPWGEVIEDRGSQITFSALGQNAPVTEKSRWDPDGSRRESLRALVAPLLTDLEVRGGGSTSVDVTLKGVDKAYGVARFAEALGLKYEAMLFVGDRLEPGGNDYPVKALGVPCVSVRNWKDTATLIDSWLGHE